MTEVPRGFNPESVSKAADLSREIKKIGIIGNPSPESDEKARDFLQTKFNGKYESVEQMMEISQNPGFSDTDPAKVNAKNALDLLGSAVLLAGGDEMLDLANKGELSVNLPNSFHGIDAKINSNLFISNENDDTGKLIVTKLREMEAFNIKAKIAPNAFESERPKVVQEKIGDLLGKYVEVPEESEEALKLGVVVGYLDSSIRQQTNNRPTRGEPPLVPRIGENGDYEGQDRAWIISPENAAEAMKFMAYDLRWQSWTPPEWFKRLDGETQARIEYMVMVNDGAAMLTRAGKDLDKITGNPMYFVFDNEKFTKLFNDDFKAVTSKMLHDLCEKYVDQNGRTCMRYKEGINQMGKPGIDAKVEKKLEGIRDYKEEMAKFLAKKNGREEPNYMDKMNSYTAWNMWFMMGDSSLADRRRVLPTYTGVICDGLRTLNPEYKALGKWKVSKGDVMADKLFGAEWFGGPIGSYVQTVMKVEEDLGNKGIDGGNTLRENIYDGTLPIFANKTCYGFFDFTSAGRDLYDNDTKTNKLYDLKKKDDTLSTLLYDCVEFDGDGNFVSIKKDNDFSFGKSQLDFMNEFRDQQEAAALAFNCMMGKEDIRDVDKLVNKIRTAFGMVDNIKINGSRVFSYTTRPDLWADMLLGSFGVDMSRLSNKHIRLKTQQIKANDGRIVEPSYNLYLSDFLTGTLKLSNNDVNLNEIMRYMGVDLKPGENPRSTKVTIRNEVDMAKEKLETSRVLKKQIKTFRYDTQNNPDLNDIKSKFKSIENIEIKNSEARRIYNDLVRAIKSNNGDVAQKLLAAFLENNI